MTEELWQMLGGEGLLSLHKWPEYDEAKTVDDEVEIVVQINGKIRAKLNVAADIEQVDAVALAKADEKVKAFISDVLKTVRKEKPNKNIDIKKER